MIKKTAATTTSDHAHADAGADADADAVADANADADADDIALRSVIALVRLQHAISDRSRLDRVKSNSWLAQIQWRLRWAVDHLTTGTLIGATSNGGTPR